MGEKYPYLPGSHEFAIDNCRPKHIGTREVEKMFLTASRQPKKIKGSKSTPRERKLPNPPNPHRAPTTHRGDGHWTHTGTGKPSAAKSSAICPPRSPRPTFDEKYWSHRREAKKKPNPVRRHGVINRKDLDRTSRQNRPKAKYRHDKLKRIAISTKPAFKNTSEPQQNLGDQNPSGLNKAGKREKRRRKARMLSKHRSPTRGLVKRKGKMRET